MIREIAWNTFKNTGSIDTFMEFMEVENLERSIKAEKYGDSEDKWNNYIGK